MYYEEEQIPRFEFPASLQHLVDMLQDLGLNNHEARILLYLMIHKCRIANTISQDLGINRTETYKYVSNLMKKGLVFATTDRPQKYYALPLEEATGCLVESRRNALNYILSKQREYCDILDDLAENLPNNRSVDNPEAFQLIVGSNAIFPRVKEMLARSEQEVKLLAADQTFLSLYDEGIIEYLVSLTRKGAKVRVKTSSRKILEYIMQDDSTDQQQNEKISRAIALGTAEGISQLNFIIVDSREIILLFGNKKAMRAFYSNIATLVSSFNEIFDNAKHTGSTGPSPSETSCQTQ
ncbi:MAG: helix-turn-helix domain-containing protein [Thermoproteota archaeon]